MIFNGVTINSMEHLTSILDGTELSEQQKNILKSQYLGEEPIKEQSIYPVTARQFRIELLYQGISEQSIVDAINTLPSPQKEAAMIEWEYSNEFIRTNPMAITIGSIFGKTSQELDQIWINASTR